MSFVPPRILCIGTHHKTGTVWMRRVWRMIGEALDIPFVAIHDPNKFHRIPEMDRVIVANWAAQFAPELFARRDARFLHVIRDPRDVLLSGARYHESTSGRHERFLRQPDPALNGKSYQEHLRELKTEDEKLEFEMHRMHQRVLDEMMSWPYGHERAFDVRYEDLIEDTECKLFVQALRFFGFNASECDAAREIFFDNSLFGGLSSDSSQGRVAHHVKSGKARQWQNQLPVAVARNYLNRHGNDLISLGYENDHSWINHIGVKQVGTDAHIGEAF
ncbi:sulfotransferase domain-containing protein [Epibacterium ulvae]|uniref:sulfotransferase domain-containing protein n=1 Tax=Epibacterium ulvae TaxID=1156985 RepID=UPI00248F9AD8|nr:sulfotransferase domain-containing protein [Epibacterium ulvae]